MTSGAGQRPSAVDEPPKPTHLPARSSRHDLLDTVLVSGAVMAGALSTGWPENALQWTLLLLAATLGGLAPHTSLSDLVRAGARRLLRGLRPVRLRRALAWSIVVLTASAAGNALFSAGPDVAAWATMRAFGCPNPTELRLLATPDGAVSAGELADAFERRAAEQNHDCAAVNIYVYAQPATTARDALASGWSTNHLRTLGPRPDLWLPGSSLLTPADPARSSNGLLTGVHSTSVASTPVVLAVPADLVPKDLALKRTAVTWDGALTAADRAGWGLARADPALSVAAELATVAIYTGGGAAGQPARPAPDSPIEIDAARARGLENRVARGLDRRGYPLGDDVDLVCRHRQAGGPPAALVLTEQQVARFNAGLPLGGQCPSGTPPQPPGKGLYAVYPSDTLSLDYPLVRLDWPGRAKRQRDWAGRFERWLEADAGKQALNDVGLRPPGWAVGQPLSEAQNMLPGVSYPHVRPSDRVLARVREAQAAARRPGRVLLALDASGSMREPAGPDGRSRFAVAAAGVALSLPLMTSRDEFGLWIFQGRGRGARQLVPVGPGGATVGGVPRRQAATQALRGVRPGGDTPLFRAIVDGTTALHPAPPERVNALVVLTDGEDHGSGLSRSDMLRSVRGFGVRVFVVAVGDANCGARAISEVTRATAGGCVEAGFGNLDVRLNEVFRVLWGGA